MKLRFYQLCDENQEKEFEMLRQNYSKNVQDKQKIFVTLLCSVFTIQKALEQNWSSFAFNLCGLLISIISIFVNRESQIYKYVLLALVQIFNFFYPFNRIMKILPNQDTYIDGYFIAFGTLGILNSFNFVTKYLMLTPIILFNLIVGPYQESILWSQLLKIIIMILLDLQAKYQEEVILRQLFLQAHYSDIIQGLYSKEEMFELLQIKYLEDKKQFQLYSLDKTIHYTEFEQQEFTQRIRQIKIISLLKHAKGKLHLKKQESQVFCSLEKFLYYFLNEIEEFNDLNILPKINVKSKMILLCGMGSNRVKEIRIIKMNYQKVPCAIVFLKQLHQETKVQKLKVIIENQKLLIDYLLNIFTDDLKIAINKINQLIINDKKTILRLSVHCHLIKAWNKYLNVLDFISQPSKFESIKVFNLFLVLNDIISILKFTKNKSKYLTINYQIQNNLESNFINSNYEKFKQLFINILSYTQNYSNDIIITLSDKTIDVEQLILVEISFKYDQNPQEFMQNIKTFPKLNPLSINDLNYNSKTQFILEIPISILLIRLLGPSNKLQLLSENNQLNLSFLLFKYLKPDLKLIKVQNLDSSSQILFVNESNNQKYSIIPQQNNNDPLLITKVTTQ